MIMDQMVLNAVFIPSEIKEEDTVCVLIDVIRASSTMVTFFDKGCKKILLTKDEKKSLEANPEFRESNYCICAERVEGDKSEVADVSPSLYEIERLAGLEEKTVLFRTTNGTVGVHHLQNMGMSEIYIGSLLNGEAVMKQAILKARELNMGVTVVCAGREDGRVYCIDDTYCAGILLKMGAAFAESENIMSDIQDSAQIAINLASCYKDSQEALGKSTSGKVMRNVHMDMDIELCARENQSSVVPKVDGADEYGHIVIVKL